MANSTMPKRLRFRDEDSFMCKNRGGRKKNYKLYIGAAGDVQRVDVAPDVLPADSQNGVSVNPPALPAYETPPTLPIIPPDSIDGPVLNPPILSDMPPKDTQTVMVSFPDWNNLSCDGIKNGILDLQNTLMVSRFSDPSIRGVYEQQIALGKSVYDAKCGKTDAPPPPPPPGGGIGVLQSPAYIPGGGTTPPTRGAGAGSGEKKEEKKPFPWWLIVVGGAALYFLTKGKD
jgi:hypothetical protein